MRYPILTALTLFALASAGNFQTLPILEFSCTVWSHNLAFQFNEIVLISN